MNINMKCGQYLDHVLLDTTVVAAAQDAEQLVVRDEEESRKSIAFGVQVVIQALLTFLHSITQTLKFGKTIGHKAAPLDIAVL